MNIMIVFFFCGIFRMNTLVIYVFRIRFHRGAHAIVVERNFISDLPFSMGNWELPTDKNAFFLIITVFLIP